MAGIADLLVYHPSNQDFNDCPLNFDAITIEDGERPIRYYQWRNQQASRVLVYFHGNAGSVCDRLPLASDFENPGQYNFIFAEYSGYSNDPGPKNTKTFTEDAIRLYDHLQDKFDLPIVAMGRSLGTTVATYLASKRKVEKLVLVSPLTSIVDVGRRHYPIPKFISKRILRDHSFDATLWAPHVKSPVLCLQGDQDMIVPLDIAQKQSKNFTTSELTFHIVKGAGHNDIDNFRDYSLKLNSFLNP